MNKLRVFLIKLSKKNVFIRKLLRTIKRTMDKILYLIVMIFNKVDDRIIFFEAFGGRNYTCSPKAIYEKMLTMKQFKDYQFIWAFINPDSHEVKPDKRLKIIKSKSREYYRYCAKAKYWIVNSIISESIIKKKKQIYVQCWHGTPLKKLRYDIEVEGGILNSIDEIRKRNDIDVKRYDYFISPSAYCTEKFTSAFNLKELNKENIIVEEGYPRNDSLFNIDSDTILKIKKKFGIDIDKKVLLYVPTFRDNQHESGVGYTYDLELDFKTLRKKIGNDYIVLFRAHYFIANKIDFDECKDFVINVSDYDDINDLYLISDILITDYSSVCFDYANLKRPMIFYMYDLDLYQEILRGFYLDLEELPGPIVRSENELIAAIKNSTNVDEEVITRFNKKFNYLEDGQAAKRVVEEVFQ
jgi:CDP-glycerol glycerophosphotransferase